MSMLLCEHVPKGSGLYLAGGHLTRGVFPVHQGTNQERHQNPYTSASRKKYGCLMSDVDNCSCCETSCRWLTVEMLRVLCPLTQI